MGNSGGGGLPAILLMPSESSTWQLVSVCVLVTNPCPQHVELRQRSEHA